MIGEPCRIEDGFRQRAAVDAERLSLRYAQAAEFEDRARHVGRRRRIEEEAIPPRPHEIAGIADITHQHRATARECLADDVGQPFEQGR